MSSSCSRFRQALIDCLLASPCITEHPENSFEDCLKGDKEKVKRDGPGSDGVPVECRQVQKGLYECKRGMVPSFASALFSWRILRCSSMHET